MTKIFLEEEWKSSGGGSKCLHCKAPAVKSMCQRHLNQARDRFRVWTVQRTSKCLCIKCNGRSHKIADVFGNKRQGVYCRDHREGNRKNCLRWARENRSSIRAEYWRRRKAGVCVNSPAHGRAFDKHTLCKACHLIKSVTKSISGNRR